MQEIVAQMTASASFLVFLTEVLAPLGSISVRRMFGGAGIYCDAIVFAFVDDDTLFFKTDEPGRAAFEAEGMGPFTYVTKNGPGTLLSYWRAPERLLEDGDELIAWARKALEAARASGARKKPVRREGERKAGRRPRRSRSKL